MMNEDPRSADVARRIAALSPAKRDMLQRLLARGRSGGAALASDDRGIQADRIETTAGSESIRSFYELVNRNLNSTEFARHATFLNFGYAPNGSPRGSVVPLPRHC